MPPAITDALDAWIASQPDPKPSRSEAIRIGLKAWLIGLGLMSQYDDVEALKQKIAELKLGASGKPSPAKGMAMRRRGRAKSDWAKAKNERAKDQLK
jgi:cell division septation protein DedD